MAAPETYEVLAVRYFRRPATRGEVYLNFRRYGEPDAEIGMDYFLWVISNERRTIVVDTGFSAASARRFGRTPSVEPVAALGRLGVDPARVAQVIATHAHFDHVGNLREFPSAEVIMAGREYEFWNSPVAGRSMFAWTADPEDTAELRRIRAQDRLTLFSSSHCVAPGVDVIEVGGHTPGQAVVSVATADGPVVLASDALHYYEELERDWAFGAVADLPQLYRAYDLLRELASAPGARLVPGHDPLVGARFPGRGDQKHVVRIGPPGA